MQVYDNLKNKRVLVTGASRGIGEGVARAFAKSGVRLFFHYRSDKELAEKVASELECETYLFQADLSKDDQRNAMFDEIEKVFGGLDCAVNNAGWNGSYVGKPEDITPEQYYQLTDLNIKGTLFCCLSEIRLMKRNPNGGSIINIGSVHQDTSVPGRTLYAMSKGAIHSFTGQLAIEVGPEKVRLNNVLPGYIDVKKPFLSSNENTGIPLLRYGLPSDIGSLCLFLASDESSFMNGSDIVIDGGVDRKLARLAQAY